MGIGRFVKPFSIALVAFFLLLTAIGLLMPAQTSVTRAVSVSASPARARAFLADLRNWPRWMPGAHEGGDSNHVRVGNYSVSLQRVLADRIETSWSPVHGTVRQSNFVISPLPDGGSRIEWGFVSYARWYPWERLGSIFNDKMLGPGMDPALERLRQELPLETK